MIKPKNPGLPFDEKSNYNVYFDNLAELYNAVKDINQPNRLLNCTT